jgi:hypothetical protein
LLRRFNFSWPFPRLHSSRLAFGTGFSQHLETLQYA